MKIIKLYLYSNKIDDQLRFYQDTLQLPTIESTPTHFAVQAGYSILNFQQKKEATPFHIPDKQHQEALSWIKNRVPVLKNDGQEIIDFTAWNAKSLYFYDEDRNIVELISRENFSEPVSELFSEKSILGVSELGLGTSNITQKFELLNSACKLEKYDGNLEKFCAIGDDEGLIIAINKNLKNWFPTGDKAYKSEFKLEFKQDEKIHKLIFENNILKIQGSSLEQL